MLRPLPPSALALALGTPAFGMTAIPAPEAPAAPPPSALTPPVPMRAIAPPSAPDADSVRAAAAARELAGRELAAPDSTRRDSVVAVAPAAPAPAPAPAPAAAAAPAARVLRDPVRRVAGRAAPPVRLEVALAERRLYALQGADTLLVAPAGIGTGDSLRFGARTWTFDTPAGRRRVLGKQAAPVWVPPEWHYAELAAKRGYTLRHLAPGRGESLGNGRRLVVVGRATGGRVAVREADGSYTEVRADEELVFGRTLYVPPVGTVNRRIPGQLGAYRLDLGDGFLIHGTPYEATVGTRSSHGCVRLAGDALAWVFRHVPVGAEVVIR